MRLMRGSGQESGLGEGVGSKPAVPQMVTAVLRPPVPRVPLSISQSRHSESCHGLSRALGLPRGCPSWRGLSFPVAPSRSEWSFWASAAHPGNLGFPIFTKSVGGVQRGACPTLCPKTTTAKSWLAEPARFSDFCCRRRAGALPRAACLSPRSPEGSPAPPVCLPSPSLPRNGCLGVQIPGAGPRAALCLFPGLGAEHRAREHPHRAPEPSGPTGPAVGTAACSPRQPSRPSLVGDLLRPVGRLALPALCRRSRGREASGDRASPRFAPALRVL